MRIRALAFVGTILCAIVGPTQPAPAQNIETSTPTAQTTSQDQSALPPFAGQRIEPLTPNLLPVGASNTFQSQPSGDIRMQYARLYFEQMSDHRRHQKDRAEVTLRNGTRLQGRVVSVGTDQFTIRIASTKQEISVNFSDLSSWQLAPPNDHIALNLLAAAGLELLEVAKLPLITLATLPCRCGC